MNDLIFLGVLSYLIIAGVIFILIPPDLYLSNDELTEIEVRNNIKSQFGEADADNITFANEDASLGSVKDLIAFLFAPFSIDGLPVLVKWLITILNYFSIVVGIIYSYDKFRGIGS